MNTIRTFIAIEIDQETKQKLCSLISLLKTSNADVKWANEAQMHLTLKFLGNIKESDVQKISGVLNSITADQNVFTIQFSKIGVFPNLSRPRVIWLGIEKGKVNLIDLNGKVEGELEKLGFKKEEREFKPHFTLGRVRSLKNIENLTNLIDQSGSFFIPPSTPHPEDRRAKGSHETKIDKVILFKSTLTPKGAIYTSLASHQLSNLV